MFRFPRSIGAGTTGVRGSTQRSGTLNESVMRYMTISSLDDTGHPGEQTQRHSQHQGALDLFGEEPPDSAADGSIAEPVAPLSGG